MEVNVPLLLVTGRGAKAAAAIRRDAETGSRGARQAGGGARQVCCMFWKDRRIERCLGKEAWGQLKKSRLNLRKLSTTRSNEVGG